MHGVLVTLFVSLSSFVRLDKSILCNHVAESFVVGFLMFGSPLKEVVYDHVRHNFVLIGVEENIRKVTCSGMPNICVCLLISERFICYYAHGSI